MIIGYLVKTPNGERYGRTATEMFESIKDAVEFVAYRMMKDVEPDWEIATGTYVDDDGRAYVVEEVEVCDDYIPCICGCMHCRYANPDSALCNRCPAQ